MWLARWKRATGRPAPTGDEIVAEELCFGWVDSLPRTLDAERSRILVTPRKPGSSWSARNKRLFEQALAEGIVAPAGLAAVERAKADGTWNALDEVELLVVPADLDAAFEAQPGSRAHWDGFSRSTRRAILEWIGTAKRPETRARRIEETARLARDGIKANQWRQ